MNSGLEILNNSVIDRITSANQLLYGVMAPSKCRLTIMNNYSMIQITGDIDEYITGMSFKIDDKGLRSINTITFSKLSDILKGNNTKITRKVCGDESCGTYTDYIEWNASRGSALFAIITTGNDLVRSIRLLDLPIGMPPPASNIDEYNTKYMTIINNVTNEPTFPVYGDKNQGVLCVMYMLPCFLRGFRFYYEKGVGIRFFDGITASNIYMSFMLQQPALLRNFCIGKYSSSSIEYKVIKEYLKLDTEEICIPELQEHCKDNMNTEMCRTHCSKPNVRCNAIIDEYCKKIGPEQAFDNSDICGCSMGSGFYENIKKSLESVFTIPNPIDVSRPQCFYKPCGKSTLYKLDTVPCGIDYSCYDYTASLEGYIKPGSSAPGCGIKLKESPKIEPQIVVKSQPVNPNSLEIKPLSVNSNNNMNGQINTTPYVVAGPTNNTTPQTGYGEFPIPIWGWVLIGIFILLVIVGIVIMIIRYRNKKADTATPKASPVEKQT